MKNIVGQAKVLASYMNYRLTGMRTLILSILIVLACLLTSCWSDPEIHLEVPDTDASLVRGRELTRGLAACGFCHSVDGKPVSPLSGGRLLTDRYGEVPAANITPSKNGIGDWSVDQIALAMRSSIGPDDTIISKSLHRGFDWLSTRDLLAIINYVRSQRPSDKKIERRSLDIIDRNTTGMFEGRPIIEGYIPNIDPKFQVAYGRYLVDNVARCGMCHNQPASLISDGVYLGGGSSVVASESLKVAPSLRPSSLNGVGSWSEDELVSFLQTGIRPDATEVDAQFCPVQFFANAEKNDLVAIAKYLKSLPTS